MLRGNFPFKFFLAPPSKHSDTKTKWHFAVMYKVIKTDDFGESCPPYSYSIFFPFNVLKIMKCRKFFKLKTKQKDIFWLSWSVCFIHAICYFFTASWSFTFWKYVLKMQNKSWKQDKSIDSLQVCASCMQYVIYSQLHEVLHFQLIIYISKTQNKVIEISATYSL